MEAIEFVFVVISHPSMLCFTLAKAANFCLLSLDTVGGKQFETRIINSLLCVIVLDFVALASSLLLSRLKWSGFIRSQYTHMRGCRLW